MKEKLLLHSCCAPCSTAVIKRLKDFYKITVFYFNPNIEPEEEYEKRKAEQIRYIKENLPEIDIITTDWKNNLFRQEIKGFEEEKEGGQRCRQCFKLRMKKTAQFCKNNKFDMFATTLSISPYKNTTVINETGHSAAIQFRTKFLEADFKEENGYGESIKLSKEAGLYRQNYCGCMFSKRH